MNAKKITKGQFFTKKNLWLKNQVLEFIINTPCTIAYDPFAGAGDLINNPDTYGLRDSVGLDIDESLGWERNDSLTNIPHIENAIIITNPPYLSNYSASRKKIISEVNNYFESSTYDDLYLIALDKMLDAQDYVVAIIPETFINSSFKQKNRISSITILEENPFDDTDTPVCVVCFDNIIKPYSQVKIYKNETFLFSLEKMDSFRLRPKNNIKIKFNVLSAWLALRAVDTTNPSNMIRFDYKENFNYNWDEGIKVSSRLLSVIDIDVAENKRDDFISECNLILGNLRDSSKDTILSPFKGNMKNGVRRRRLDFFTARAIVEEAYHNIYKGEDSHVEQFRLF